MLNHLAIDAGGTSTRAVFLTSSGQCLGYGTAAGGNPVSSGFEPAVASLVEASRQALSGTPGGVSSALVGLAGASLELPAQRFRERFIPLGLTGDFLIESDLLAAFYSGSYHNSGYALIAGTGAVAARIVDTRLAAVADGTGWLLGDDGAGFWLGREAVRAVAGALDGRAQATALTALVLHELQIIASGPQARTQGRVAAQQQLIAKVYAMKPIEISRFAPLVFAATDDPVAADIIDRAAAALTRALDAVMDQGRPGPLVFGGSVLTKGGTVAAAVLDRLARRRAWGTVAAPVAVADGAVGAAVLVLMRSGIAVDAAVFERIVNSLAELRD